MRGVKSPSVTASSIRRRLIQSALLGAGRCRHSRHPPLDRTSRKRRLDLERQLGSFGTGAGQLQSDYFGTGGGVAVSESTGDVYVTDTGNARIEGSMPQATS